MSMNILCSAVTEGKEASLPNAKPPGDRVFQALLPGDQVLLLKLLTEPIDYTDHPDFAKRGVEKKLFGRTAELSHNFATRFEEAADPITDAVQAGERVPSLSYAQEGHLFMRFNYARKRVADMLTEYLGKKLTALATRQLLAWGHRVLASRAVIVRLNMPLVLAMAKRTRLSSVDFNEMVSEGNMALLRSVEKFDCARGFKFSTYSCRAILKSFSRVAMRASRYRGQFPAEFEPSMEKSDYLELQREGLERDCVDELKEILLANLAGLSDVERKVITERFAVGPTTGYDAMPKTLEQVGMLIGVTKERVRQIQNKALRKIRLALENKFLAA
ncbi:MAG: sigma-70 family RNA polymerase sigma factor [Planctomycetota bacterium]